jgi:4-amino-4-deoxy-L-arabinose transferase-like glycosyltransferase
VCRCAAWASVPHNFSPLASAFPPLRIPELLPAKPDFFAQLIGLHETADTISIGQILARTGVVFLVAVLLLRIFGRRIAYATYFFFLSLHRPLR